MNATKQLQPDQNGPRANLLTRARANIRFRLHSTETILRHMPKYSPDMQDGLSLLVARSISKRAAAALFVLWSSENRETKISDMLACFSGANRGLDFNGIKITEKSAFALFPDASSASGEMARIRHLAILAGSSINIDSTPQAAAARIVAITKISLDINPEAENRAEEDIDINFTDGDTKPGNGETK